MEKNILTLLEKLVAFRSATSNKEEGNNIIDYVAKYLNNKNATIKKYVHEGYSSMLVYSKNHSPNKPFQILLNAHLDVVPAPAELFNLTIKGNKAYGRGVCDMKGAAACMIELFKNLIENNTLPEDVGLMLVTDEEIGGFSGTGMLAGEKEAQAKFFLGGEPTNLNILTAHKGVLKVTVSHSGTSAHASHLWKGKNANVTLAQQISHFYLENPIPKKEVWATTYSLNMMSGGTAFNVVPNYAEATFDIRRIETDSPQKIINKMKKYFPKAEIKVTMNEPGLETKTNTAEIKKLEQLIKKYSHKCRFIKEHYATDGRFYGVKKVPAVHFGIVGGGMHQIDEWIDIKSLSIYYKILQEYLAS